MFFVCVKLIIFHLEVNRISRKFTLICPILFNIFPFPPPKGCRALGGGVISLVVFVLHLIVFLL